MKKNISEINQTIKLFKVFNPPNLEKKISEVLKSGYLSEGDQVKKFSKKLSKFLKNRNIVCFNSCTSALTVAYNLAGIKKNCEVISTPSTCVAANIPLLHLGAKIIWADTNLETGMTDLNDIKKKLTKKTKAVIVLHKDGVPFEIDKLREIIIKKKLKTKIIEDAAHAFGATYNGKKIGNHGDFVAFSFQAIKQIHTCDGGALVCRSKNDYLIAKKLKWLGIDRENRKKNKNIWLNDITYLGYKSNLSELPATIGIEQMKYVRTLIKRNNSNGNYYDKNLKNINGLKIFQRHKNSFSTFWLYSFLSEKKTELLKKLKDYNIESFQVHPRNDKYTIFKKFKSKLKNLDKFENQEINVPCGWWLKKKDLDKIIKIIKDVHEKN